MTDSVVLDRNLVVDFNRESTDLLKTEPNMRGITKNVAFVSAVITVGLTIMFGIKDGVQSQELAPAFTKEYFGDEVSLDTKEYAESKVSAFFADIDISNSVAELRSNSSFSYDNADTEARALQLLAEDTKLLSVDKVTSIEDEYRVYVTIASVDGVELMNANRAYLSQAFCSNRNELTENGINKVLLDVIEKDAEPTSAIETYVTIKDDSVDASQLVSVLTDVYHDMRNMDL